MNQALRVFISSTMEDLANERDAVCEKLRELNFEPVNAEGWPPSANLSWETIRETLESSDVVLLLLGERYGWIPRSGPMSGEGLSVTHIEYREAQRLNIPVLPFLKNLPYDKRQEAKEQKEAEEIINRDRFRDEVGDWEKGLFVQKFNLARDLSHKVGKALVQFLTDDYLRSRVKKRAIEVDRLARKLQDRTPTQAHAPLNLPIELVTAVFRKQAVLIAGAGMSLAAGMPSADAARSHLAQAFFPEFNAVDHLSFAQLAAAVQSKYSRDVLIEELSKLLDPPHGAAPTRGHQLSLDLFSTIITTNWDNLFETAAQNMGDQRDVIQPGSKEFPERAIVKLHGSMSMPETVVVTEPSVYDYAGSHPQLWSGCIQTISRNIPVLVGTSLHDPSMLRLLDESRLANGGYVVMPNVDPLACHRLAAWNLKVIDATAQQFFEALETAISTLRKAGIT